VDLEWYRKNAKSLVRTFRAGDPKAIARAEAVLGGRARERFALSDAQHVVAVEQGHRSWTELVKAPPHEWTIETGLEYGPGDPVVLRAVQRRHVQVDDQGGAVARAGAPPGWRDVADQIADAAIVNIARNGNVSLPVVGRGPGLDAIVERIGRASLMLYEELLDLDD
jgi:hypothetical protein